MKEQLIEFETAVLAKEKGFLGIKSQCHNWYYDDGFLTKNNRINGYENLKSWNNWEATQGIRWDAPTQSLLQKWLRDKHNYNIIVFNDDGGIKEASLRYNFEIRYILPSFKNKDKNSMVGKYNYKSYEKALEKGLSESLKLIKL